MKKKLAIRITVYLSGLFIMTLGIALSVKSNLGVSPISSIPYAMTCVWGIEMGKATIIFHCFLVLVQALILRKRFKPISLMQIAAGVVFGYFTTFCNFLFSFLPTPESIVIRLCMILISVCLIALGIFLYLPANIISLAAEGTVKAITISSGLKFSKVKILFDCSMVLISGTVCLIALKSLGSVGAGTLISAVSVGAIHAFLTKRFAKNRDRLLQGD